MKIISDIQYANISQSQKLDLYLPESIDNEEIPLIFFIHGGGFSKGDKTKGKINAFLRFVDKKYIIASTNYRLSGEAGFPAGIEDCKNALSFLIANSKKYRIDPTKVAIVGTSSGGNYALMLGLDKSLISKFEKKCVVALYPVTDLLALKNIANNLKNDNPTKAYMVKNSEMYFNKKFSNISAEELKLASPLYNLTKDLPYTLLQHGTADDVSPISQSKEFYEKALKLRIEIEFDVFKNAKHNDEVFETFKNMERIFGFIKNSLA